MNNFIQHVTGQLVWLGEHRGLFLLLIVELFAGVCLLIGFFQLKIKKQNEAAGVFKGGSGSFGVPGNGDPVMILRCKDLYPVYITESFEQQLDVTGDDIKTDIGIFLDLQFREKLEAELELLSAEASITGMEKAEFLKLCDGIYSKMKVCRQS